MSEIHAPKVSSNGYTTAPKGPSQHISEQIYQVLEIIFVALLWTAQCLYYIGESIYRTFKKAEPRSVEGEIVLITGTGHGIGKQLALQYAEAGATVVGWDINKENNDETIKEINQRYKNKAHGYICNVANRENTLEVAKKVQQEVGEVTILIANAGIMPSHRVDEHSPSEIQRIIDINIMQIFWLLEAFLPSMKKNNYGHIVGISSVAGLAGFKYLVPYCATKWAVRGLLESLHEELRMDRNNKINTTTIYPYMVNTGLCKNTKIRFNIFMKMLAPEEVARGIMMAQRRNEPETSLPPYLLYFQSFLRLFPCKAMENASDLIDTGIESDLHVK